MCTRYNVHARFVFDAVFFIIGIDESDMVSFFGFILEWN